MNTSEIKKEIKAQLDKADVRTLRAIRAFLKEMNASKEDSDYIFTEDFVAVLEDRKASYLKGESKTYTPEEVKAKALNRLKK